MVCVPSGITEVEERAVIDATNQAGAKKTYLVEEPIAAALGAGINIEMPDGNMVVDIGGGTTDLAVISSGCILLSDSIRMAGDKFNETLMAYMKYKHGLNIGERNAEDIKVTYGRAHADTDQRVIDIRGRDAATGPPESVPLGTNEIADALYPALSCIVASIRDLLSRIPAPMVESIQKKGIMLTGGGALLEGLPALITEQSECACRVAEDPLGCVARGTGIVLEDLNGYRNAIYDYRRGEYYEG
jgi:rod shape-determining protein MreB